MNRRGKGCLSYVILTDGEAIVIDPSRNAGEYERFVASLGATIAGAFDTHVHADHISGTPKLARHANVPASIRILETPGHTPSSRSFLIGDRYLLTGDTIFVESVGRPDLGGQVVEWGRMLFHTLTERIATLPDETVILPAHYASTSEIGSDGVVSGRLGNLRRTVPELQIRSEGEFIEAMKKALKTPPEVYEKIIRVNLGQQAVDEETATEWELGKNECAASVRRAQEVPA
jgi:glyoxylase-like metal-dependent hydrolase (beta-lactamase superfamily II)